MKNRMPKMDMGGLYAGAAMSRDVENQPISGYGTSEVKRCPPDCGNKTAPKSKSGGIDYNKRRKEQEKIKPSRCRRT